MPPMGATRQARAGFSPQRGRNNPAQGRAPRHSRIAPPWVHAVDRGPKNPIKPPNRYYFGACAGVVSDGMARSLKAGYEAGVISIYGPNPRADDERSKAGRKARPEKMPDMIEEWLNSTTLLVWPKYKVKDNK